jgi:hypothetical protein
MHLEKLVNSKTGKILASIILGFGLATLFRKVCKEKNCIVLKSPPLNELSVNVYKHENKCYKFESISTRCDSSKTIVNT